VVADDHPAVLRSVCDILIDAGVDVVGRASNGEEAAAKIESTRPAVAVVDVRMPRMTGIEVAAQVSRTTPETQVILYTAYGDRALLSEALDAGVRGFKFHPNTQAFWPNDRDHYRVYEPIAKAGLIALFHSGTTGIGAGMPGGGGVRLKYSNPMCVDDLAADFPDLRIILAHPSFPWQDEALAVAVHKPNVYIDLSGWSPKYFPENLIRYTNTQLRHKMLFGSDYPTITPDRWLADFAKLPIKDEVRPLVLRENAAKLLGLR